jgi:hypothetical protein
MTRFQDGPAKGQTLMLNRAPRFLRVVEKGGKFDALDQLDDKPEAGEKIYAYEIVGEPGSIHINRGGGRGGFYTMGEYKLVAEQPTDAQMRTLQAWRGWCEKTAGVV